MVIFGLILLLVALAVVLYMWLATRGMDPVQITYGPLNVDITPIWLFVVGGITLAAATCGIWLLAVGTRSKARKAKEVRELRRQAKDSGHTTGTGRGSSPRDTGATSTTAPGGRGNDGPILPRSGGGSTTGGAAGTPGSRPTDGQSSLDLGR